MERVRRVYSRAPLKGLLRRSQGRFRGAIICGSFKMVLVPLFFTEKPSTFGKAPPEEPEPRRSPTKHVAVAKRCTRRQGASREGVKGRKGGICETNHV
jgi:hypothetical protein